MVANGPFAGLIRSRFVAGPPGGCATLVSKHLLMQAVPSVNPAPLAPPAVRKSRMQSDDRHRQLLRVAIDLFARNGFSGTKTKDIAAAAGVSEAILFRHFATKEDLYHAILDLQEKRANPAARKRQLQALMDRRDDLGLLRQLATGVISGFAADPAFHRLMMYASLEGHLMANLFRERFVFPTGHLLNQYISTRQKEGVFRNGDAKVATMFAIGTFVHFAMTRHVFGAKRAPCGDALALEELVHFVFDGLTGGLPKRPLKEDRSPSRVHPKGKASGGVRR